MTKEEKFNKALNLVKNNPSGFDGQNPRQVHLSEVDESYEKDGFFCLCYDPFSGNWRLTNSQVLAKVPVSLIV